MSIETDDLRRRFDPSFLLTNTARTDELTELQQRFDALQRYANGVTMKLSDKTALCYTLYTALDDLRGRYVPNDSLRPEVAAADSALVAYAKAQEGNP